MPPMYIQPSSSECLRSLFLSKSARCLFNTNGHLRLILQPLPCPPLFNESDSFEVSYRTCAQCCVLLGIQFKIKSRAALPSSAVSCLRWTCESYKWTDVDVKEERTFILLPLISTNWNFFNLESSLLFITHPCQRRVFTFIPEIKLIRLN